MTDRDTWCGSRDHFIGRRQFMGTTLAGVGGAVGASLFTHPLGAAQVAERGKSMVVIFLEGGLSQFESWDPKSHFETGGPFKAIPTSVPGIHISELLPHTAKQMHHLALIRSIKTNLDDHALATNIVRSGRMTRSATEYPDLGAVVAKAKDRDDFPLPGHIFTSAGGNVGRGSNAAYLGPKFASVTVAAEGGGVPNTVLPDGMNVTVDTQRNTWRRFINSRYARSVHSAELDAFTQSYEQALKMMTQRDVFDLSKEPQAVRDKYGHDELGKQLLLARRLVEHEVPYIEVKNGGHDTHWNNFEFHIHNVTFFDRPFAVFIEDMAERGLLERTLVVVMTEFGRTAEISVGFGRGHGTDAWSIALGGCGIQKGAVIGKTNDSGKEVIDRQVDHRHLFHTFLRAVGIDSSGQFNIAGRPFPIADPAAGPIEELLA